MGSVVGLTERGGSAAQSCHQGTARYDLDIVKNPTYDASTHELLSIEGLTGTLLTGRIEVPVAEGASVLFPSPKKGCERLFFGYCTSTAY